MPNYNEVISRKSCISPPPEITGVAKGIWLRSQMKKPHSLRESSSQPWGTTKLQEPRGCGPLQKGSFLTQEKICLWKKYAPADRGEQMGGRCFLHWDGSAILWIRAGCSSSWKPSDGLFFTTVQLFSPNPRWAIAKPSLDSRQMVHRW